MIKSYLFAYYTLDSQVSFSSCMSIKTDLFFFLTFCFISTPISGIIDHYCIMENLKKNREKIRTNEEQYTLKIMNILRAASIGSNFSGSYKNKSVTFFLQKASLFEFKQEKSVILNLVSKFVRSPVNVINTKSLHLTWSHVNVLTVKLYSERVC